MTGVYQWIEHLLASDNIWIALTENVWWEHESMNCLRPSALVYHKERAFGL